MNKVILMGRLTRDPEVRYTAGDNGTAVATYTLAVDRRGAKSGDNGGQTADFIRCVAFGKAAEFTEKYLKTGVKMLVSGRIQTGSYTNRDGQKVYTTDVVIEEQEFAESKKSAEGGSTNTSTSRNQQYNAKRNDDFMNIPDTADDETPW